MSFKVQHVHRIEHTHRLGMPVFKIAPGDLVNLGLLALMVLPSFNRVADWIVNGGNSRYVEASTVVTGAAPQYHSPIPGRSLEEFVNYQPTHGQSFGPKTGNLRDYDYDGVKESPHGGIDFDCTIGGCAGADVAAVIGGTVIATDAIATSANGTSYRVEVLGDDGYHQRYVHVDSLTVSVGDYVHGGQIIAKVAPTDSVSTGPHLDLKILKPGGGEWHDPQIYFAEARQKNYEAISQVNDGDGQLSDAEIRCGIGAAEGTLNDDCSPNHNYAGHQDPGNGVWNLGAFSYQHGARSPEEADQKQLNRLRNAEQEIQAQATGKFGQPLSEAALLTALDLWNQAPAAGQDFVRLIPTHDPSPAQIIEARSLAFIEPSTGRLNAPGLGNNMNRVREDQQRRVDEVLESLN